MADRAASRLSKMNSAVKKGAVITVHSGYMSLLDMINTRGDEYPSESHLDAYNYGNTFHDVDQIAKFNKLYRIKKSYKVIKVEPGDRSCHWQKDAL